MIANNGVMYEGKTVIYTFVLSVPAHEVQKLKLIHPQYHRFVEAIDPNNTLNSPNLTIEYKLEDETGHYIGSVGLLTTTMPLDEYIDVWCVAFDEEALAVMRHFISVSNRSRSAYHANTTLEDFRFLMDYLYS